MHREPFRQVPLIQLVARRLSVTSQFGIARLDGLGRLTRQYCGPPRLEFRLEHFLKVNRVLVMVRLDAGVDAT